jgi:hypothetical protein
MPSPAQGLMGHAISPGEQTAPSLISAGEASATSPASGEHAVHGGCRGWHA